jgi:RNA polymerase sigma-70 factor (ECF subfamily)
VEAFLAAARDGDFDALLALLDGDVVLHVDAAAAGTPTTIRGAQAVAANARAFSANARFAEPALVDGVVGIVVAPAGRLALVLRFAVTGDLISDISIDADPATLRRFNLALLDSAKRPSTGKPGL